MGPRKPIEESGPLIRTPVNVICEGLTEKKYLEHFNVEHRETALFDFYEIKRYSIDYDNTMRGDLITIADEYVFYKKYAAYRPFLLSTMILSDFFKEICRWVYYPHVKDTMNRLKSILRSVRTTIVKNTECDDRGAIKNTHAFKEKLCDLINSDETIGNLVKGILSGRDEFVFPYEYSNFDTLVQNNQSQITTKSDANKELTFIVFDTDYHPNPKYRRTYNDMISYIERCESLNYHLLLSHPKFELWLLMHHPNVNFSELLDAPPRELPDRIDNKLLELEEDEYAGKDIPPETYNDFFKGKFDFAFENAKSPIFSDPSDNRDVADRPGTSVPYYLDMLINNKPSL